MQTATKRTHCPNCGARLPEQPLSLCAYCAMPLDLAQPKESHATSPNAPKFAKIVEQEGFPAAMQRTPHEGPAYQHSRHRCARGRWLLGVGALLLACGGFALIRGGWLYWPCFAGGLPLAILGTTWWLGGQAQMRQILSAPLQRRAAVILERRSDTALKGWYGHCDYYFRLEFPDGTTGEYCYPGRGASEDLYVNGMTGVAYTRGTELLEFEHIRI